MNCVVEDPDYLIKDFQSIGFKEISCETGIDYFTKNTSYYIRGVK
jgi:hypothetical protein